MASFSVNGLDELMLSLEEMMNIPDDVANEMLIAGAEIVEEAQLESGMKLRVYLTGETLHAIAPTRPKRGRDGREISVYPQGVNSDGNRNAEVAFLNEYGVPSKGMPAKQFIRIANENAADKVAETEADIYYKWLDGLGF